MGGTDSGLDIIDVRDIIARYEELRDELFDDDGNQVAGADEDDREEFDVLKELLDDLRGNGGDEQWEGNWYPVTLISDDHWATYAQDFAEEIGAISSDTAWPNNCIDWEKAADELQMDYTSVEYGSTIYWYR